MKAWIIGCALGAAAVLSGCSAVRIGYDQAPTLVWWWLDGYLDFDTPQAPAVKDALAQWFAWHRATQLPDYAELLAAAQVQVLQPATPAQVCRWNDELRARAETALTHAVPPAAELLPRIGPAQLEHLEQRYRRSNREFEQDFLQADPDERRAAAVERTIDRAEMLYGRLDARQRQLVAAGVEASPFDPAAWLAERREVQAQVLQTLARLTAGGPARADRDSNVAGLKALAQRLLRAPPGPYRDYQRRLTEYNCAFIARLHNSTMPAQRLAARDRLRGWEEDLRILAARKPPADAARPSPALH
ncbi:MAG: hypothetical protein J0L57_14350 [Burkholderiales bacterium]|nr:hypothetical protein [Burkholderiales bacterium]